MTTSPDRVFISHAAPDRAYAHALEQVIDTLADSQLDIRYSTSSEAGPQGGAQWRDWIDQQVLQARTAIIVVTPESLAKPWLMWEAGACRGVALAQAAVPDATNRKLVTIAYGLSEAECPDPLRGEQIVMGTDRERVGTLLGEILAHHGLPSTIVFAAGGRRDRALGAYLADVQAAQLQSASLPTEANIREWLSRLDELTSAGRLSELDGFVRWMQLAFGRSDEAARLPIDIRLHRRLGELYLGERNHDAAVRELSLARLAAPRDIYILRPLGEAYLKRYLANPALSDDSAERAEIAQLLAMIEDIDPGAYLDAPDTVALQSKFYRRTVRDLRKAAAVLQHGLERSPDSYYLADLLAQTLLEDQRLPEARRAFRESRAILDRTADQSIWASASYATACLAEDDLDSARERLRSIVNANASRGQLESVALGVREVGVSLGVSEEDLQSLLEGYPRVLWDPG